MTEEEKKTLDSLAATLVHTRIEVDALRTLLIATTATLANNPETAYILKTMLRGGMEGDTAIVLATTMTDQMIQSRHDALLRMLPSGFLDEQ